MEWIVEAESLSDFVDHGRYTIHTKPLIRCNECKYYHGAPGAMGHAPCSYWGSDGVMWDWFCSQGEKYERPDQLISRQAAIDALMEKDKKLRNINWYDKPYAEGECAGIDEAMSIISNLPSAQPEMHEKRTETHSVCLDTIDRQAAIDALEKHEKSNGHNYTLFVDIVSECAEIIRDLPSAQPERKHGEWIILTDCANEGVYCSECRKKVFKVDFSNTMQKWKNYKFCPNCGAKMEVENG